MNIPELLERSTITTEILRIANDLQTDSNYSKDTAAQELLKMLELHSYI